MREQKLTSRSEAAGGLAALPAQEAARSDPRLGASIGWRLVGRSKPAGECRRRWLTPPPRCAAPPAAAARPPAARRG